MRPLFEWNIVIGNIPGMILVSIDSENTDQRVEVELRVQGSEISYRMQRTCSDDLSHCSWQFELPLANMPQIPTELMDLEDEISDYIIEVDE